MSETIVWEAPPKQQRTARKPKWEPLLQDHKNNPGAWGRLPDPMPKSLAYSLATRINTGKLAGIEQGEFRAVSRRQGDDYYVWVCYKPEEGSQPDLENDG